MQEEHIDNNLKNIVGFMSRLRSVVVNFGSKLFLTPLVHICIYYDVLLSLM